MLQTIFSSFWITKESVFNYASLVFNFNDFRYNDTTTATALQKITHFIVELDYLIEHIAVYLVNCLKHYLESLFACGKLFWQMKLPSFPMSTDSNLMSHLQQHPFLFVIEPLPADAFPVKLVCFFCYSLSLLSEF